MLTVTNLCRSYGTVQVLKGVDFSLESGSIGALTGPSGVGKTTLLNVIAGLDRPDIGAVHWHKRTLTSDREWQPPWARPFAMVFQQFGLWPHLTVADHLRVVLRARRELTRTKQRGLCDRWLTRLQLKDLSSRYPGELSGGQQQRVAIARSLARDPELLLLDEPFSLLDEATARITWDVVRDWREESAGTMLVVTHDMAWIRRFATRVFLLQRDGLRERLASEESSSRRESGRWSSALRSEAWEADG